MRTHLHKHFTRMAAHHAAKSAHHAAKSAHHHALAAHYGKMSKGAKSEMDNEADGAPTWASIAQAHKSLGELHAQTSAEHASMGEHCAACAKVFAGTGKAMMGGGDELEPLRVSAVAPTRPGLQAVPRFGAPAMAPPNVPSEFQKLVSVDDAEGEQ